MSVDRRISARIPVQLWARVDGLEQNLMLRGGNVSATGVMIEMPHSLGVVGELHTLHLALPDRSAQVEIPAALARVVQESDAWRGRTVRGIAYHFLPQTEAKRELLQAFIRRLVLSQWNPQAAAVRPALAEVADEKPSLRSMVLETDWPVFDGEIIRVELEAPESNRKFKVAGHVLRTLALPGEENDLRYRVEVTFESVERRDELKAPNESLAHAIDQLLEESLGASGMVVQQAERDALRGDLASVSVPSLLAFFEMERMSGVLSLDGATKLYFRTGQLIDITNGRPASDPPRALLAKLCKRDKGAFEFWQQEITRDDRIGMPTSALLLDVLREQDELNSG